MRMKINENGDEKKQFEMKGNCDDKKKSNNNEKQHEEQQKIDQ